MKICYVEKSFRPASLSLIEKVNAVIDEYRAKGYELTLRQVYYQMVARDIIPNNERSYKNMGNLISDGRLAGLIDWDAIIDRTRNLRSNSHWDSPGQIIRACANQYAVNTWEGQENYVEVWVEKDALIGVVGKACSALDVPYFSCRGYVSQSEMWAAARRLQRAYDKEIHILHLGDHDPSGKDMSRDIVERLELFGTNVNFKRLALNMDQIEFYSPPPNPAKITDSRSDKYIAEFGNESWELDALKPEVIERLIEDEVLALCDMDLREKKAEEAEKAQGLLKKVSENWQEIAATYSK